METFKHDYDAYYLKQQNVTYEKLYQEALAIYLAKYFPTEPELELELGTRSTSREIPLRTIRRRQSRQPGREGGKQKVKFDLSPTFHYLCRR